MRDRDMIVQIIRERRDAPNADAEVSDRLEAYCATIRNETLGWMYAYACTQLDQGQDLRWQWAPEILKAYQQDCLNEEEVLCPIPSD